MKCSFCKEECDGKMILIDSQIEMKDGSDVVLCDICMNLYVNKEYDKLIERITQKK